jgi:hypothetical protein
VLLLLDIGHLFAPAKQLGVAIPLLLQRFLASRRVKLLLSA